MANNPKRYKGGILQNFAKYLIGEQGTPAEIAARRAGVTPIIDENNDNMITGYNWGDYEPSVEDMNNLQEDIDKYTKMQDISKGVTIPQIGGLAMNAVREHPFKAMALGGSAAGNIGGLTDNDKFGGQLAGLGLGGLGAYALGDALGPYGKIMMTMGGGNLGALFDKLRARKEQEQAQPYYGGR